MASGSTQSPNPSLQQLEENANSFWLHVTFFRSFIRPKGLVGRIISIIITIILTVMCIYQMYAVISKYMDYPVDTKTQEVHAAELKLPKITICTESHLNSTKIQNLGVDNDLRDYMLSAFGESKKQNASEVEKLDKKYKEFVGEFENASNKSFDLTSFFIENGIDCQEVFEMCMFRGRSFDCCQKPAPFLSSKGKCFQLIPDLVQTFPGPTGGVTVVLKDISSVFPGVFENGYGDNKGFEVYVSFSENQMEGSDRSIWVSLAASVSIQLTLTERKRLPQPFGDCVHAHNDKTLQYFPNYTGDACYKECLADMIMRSCGCVPVGFVPKSQDKSKHPTFCGPQSDVRTCVSSLFQGQSSPLGRDVCTCPLECESLKIDGRPNVGKMAKLPFQTNAEALNDSTVVTIFYPEMVYFRSESHVTYSMAKLLFEICLILVLYLGVNILVLCQTILHAVWEAIRKTKKI